MPNTINEQSPKLHTEKKKTKCKGCGKKVTLLLSHLERTKLACQNSYDMSGYAIFEYVLCKYKTKNALGKNPQDQ